MKIEKPSPIEKLNENEGTQPTLSDMQPTPSLPEELDRPDTAFTGESLTSMPKESLIATELHDKTFYLFTTNGRH